MIPTKTYARPPSERRAFSLLELLAVITIVGLVAGMAALRYGEATLGVTHGQGYSSKVAQALQLARRHAITSGGSAALRFQRSSGVVTGFDVVRVSGSDVLVEKVYNVPNGVSVTTPADRWEFGFDGGLTIPAGSGTIVVSNGTDNWSVYVYALSGRVLLTGS